MLYQAEVRAYPFAIVFPRKAIGRKDKKGQLSKYSLEAIVTDLRKARLNLHLYWDLKKENIYMLINATYVCYAVGAPQRVLLVLSSNGCRVRGCHADVSAWRSKQTRSSKWVLVAVAVVVSLTGHTRTHLLLQVSVAVGLGPASPARQGSERGCAW